MSDQVPVPARKSWLPDTSSGFWRFCLLASLMLNLIVIGLVAGGVYRHRFGHRPEQAGFAQFVPKMFVQELPRERRRELMSLFHDSTQQLRAMREQGGADAVNLAHELASPSYDAAKAAALIDDFATGPNSLAKKGGDLLKDFIAKLTPEERASLAKAIEERARNRAP